MDGSMVADLLCWGWATVLLLCCLGAAHRFAVRALLYEDLAYLRRVLPIVLELKRCQRHQVTLADVWAGTCAARPGKTAIVDAESDDARTFDELDCASDRVARWIAAADLYPRDVCAVLLDSSIDLVVLSLALAKCGVAIALLHTDCTADSLRHALRVAQCKALIHGARFEPVVASLAGSSSEGDRTIALGSDAGADADADAEVGSEPARVRLHNWGEDGSALLSARASDSLPSAPDRHASRLGPLDVFGYIFTSGTTGLPKACVIKHYRWRALSMMASAAWGVREADVLYTPLPLHHTAGLCMGVGAMIHGGCTVMIRRRFSARALLPECARHRATVLQHIGDVARMLLATREGPADRAHCLRLAFGNGLQRDAWRLLQQRFAIPEVGEFYGSTEGNLGFNNHLTRQDHPTSGCSAREHTRGIGAVGRAGLLLHAARGFEICRYDPNTLELLRDPTTGRCVPCARGEAGELLGRISERLSDRFEGYTSRAASERKLARSVRRAGDAYFRTGDALVWAEDGYLYYEARLGDTLRWRGENISALQVEQALGECAGLSAALYGVAVPGADGRACMAAIETRDGAPPDLPAISARAAEALPAYARPLFLRHMQRLPRTETHKLQKATLAAEGIDPAAAHGDEMWYWDRASGRYARLDSAAYERIVCGEQRL
jgi:acyl-CoA synthetase (AMP-forming)/AMP-acid ligase II